MKPNIKKLFQKTLNIESIDSESKKPPTQNDLKISHLEEFRNKSSKN